MKRFILFIACMILSFSACSNQNNDGRQVADNINSSETAITTSDSNVGTIHSSDTSNTPAASEKTDATAAAITTPSSENNTFSRESSETLPPSVTENTVFTLHENPAIPSLQRNGFYRIRYRDRPKPQATGVI